MDENRVIGQWFDKRARMGRLDLQSGHSLHVGMESDGTLVTTNAAYTWNRSNPIYLKAKTLKTLIKRVETCQHKLVRR